MKLMRKTAVLLLAFLMAAEAGCAGTTGGETPSGAVPSSENTVQTVQSEATEEAVRADSFEESKYRFEALKKAGAVKILGRTEFLNDKLTMDWSGSGVVFRVRTAGETMTIEYESSYAMYYSVEVDGVETAREHTEGKGFLRIPLKAGEHTVSVVKDTEISIKDKSYSYLNYVRFGGDFLKAPDEKPYLIEVIGDSIACGDGALGVFTPGVNYALSEHSAKASFGVVAANELGADYSLVTRGGIGLLKARDELNRRMIDIYEYASPYNNRENPYDFSARFPNLVILELGTNDGEYTAEEWVPALDEMVKMIRSHNGVIPILWVGKSTRWYEEVQKYISDNDVIDMYAMQYSYGTSGSGSPATATAGHPNAAEQYEMGTAVAEFIRKNTLLEPRACFIDPETETSKDE